MAKSLLDFAREPILPPNTCPRCKVNKLTTKEEQYVGRCNDCTEFLKQYRNEQPLE